MFVLHTFLEIKSVKEDNFTKLFFDSDQFIYLFSYIFWASYKITFNFLV